MLISQPTSKSYPRSRKRRAGVKNRSLVLEGRDLKYDRCSTKGGTRLVLANIHLPCVHHDCRRSSPWCHQTAKRPNTMVGQASLKHVYLPALTGQSRMPKYHLLMEMTARNWTALYSVVNINQKTCATRVEGKHAVRDGEGASTAASKSLASLCSSLIMSGILSPHVTWHRQTRQKSTHVV